MTTTSTPRTPYEEFHPGEVIEAERMNGMQIDIQDDIAQKLADATAAIIANGVDHAVNADHFDGQTPQSWIGALDQRYAAKQHNHEGQSVYRRYFKRFTTEAGCDTVLLPHKLGRLPLVDVYELVPVTTHPDFADCKLLFFYADEDADTYGLYKRAGRDRALLGLPFERLLDEVGVQYQPDHTLEDVLGEYFEAFRRDPNDDLRHGQTPWVNECCGQRRTVAQLKRAGQWEDLYLAINPRKSGKGADLIQSSVGPIPGSAVEVTQVNYDTLHIAVTSFDAAGENGGPAVLDLMLLLRI